MYTSQSLVFNGKMLNMEENKDKLYSEGTDSVVSNSDAQNAEITAEQEQSAEVKVEQAQAPAEQVERPTPQAASQTTSQPAPQAQKPKGKKKKGLTFGKAFLAALLAVMACSVLTFVFWISLFSGISSIMEPKAVGVPEQAILHINFNETILDAPSNNPIAGIDIMTMQPVSQLTLYDALRAVEAAATDERIKGIYINLTGGGTADITIIEELRAAIEAFKTTGKWVVAYNEIYSQGTYYLATVADKIYMQPEGTFDWSGMSMNTIFFKGLIDKLGVQVDILRPTACKYKSAVEPYFLDKMSDANREQMQQLVNQMWSVIVEAVSTSRNISPEELNSIADELAVILPQQALEHKFIDGIMYADEVKELFKSEYGIEEPAYISLADYASGLTTNPKKLSAPKVAIVYANGQVIDGNGTDDNIYGYTLSEILRKVAKDDDVKSVVVRVNSPGGSALASDIIWREMELLKAKKPVIVSMGSYAASGGYYISAPADAIVADRTTLTGSIGVFGLLPSFGKALKDKVGVTIDGVKTNANSLTYTGFAPLSSAQYRAMMQSVDRIYERFTSLVAEGRNLTIERVLEIAEGRVWSGQEAQQIGLVDTCGGLTAALAIAVDKAELGENFQIVEVKDELTGFMAILNSLNVSVRQHMTARSELGELYNQYKRVEQMIGKEGVYTLCPYIFNIE